MPSNYQPVLTIGELTSPETNIQFIDNCRTVTECDNLAHPLPDGDHLDIIEDVGEELPRLVIRGESIPPLTTTNPKAAIIDWLNFTFPFTYNATNLFELENKIVEALGFGISLSRNKGYLGYSDSWDLGHKYSKSYGILATGGQTQGNTCLISLSGSGCIPINNWQAVYNLLVSLSAKITRVDLAHDDFEGVYNITAALEMWALGQFTTSGRPPNAQFINDFDSGKGKTLYIGNRSNGKLLRVYEKGKQLGDLLSLWVRWELELHNKDRLIPLDVLLRPGDYLAGGYPCLFWICESQDRIKTTRKQLMISYEHLKKYCRLSYGKLIHVMHEGLGLQPLEIVQVLSVVGIPPRLDLPSPRDTQEIIANDQNTPDLVSTAINSTSPSR